MARWKLVAGLQVGPERVRELPGVTQQAGEERDAREYEDAGASLSCARAQPPRSRVFEADCPFSRLLRPPRTPGLQIGRVEGVGSLGHPQNPYWNLCRLEQGGSAALRKQGKLRPGGGAFLELPS